MASTSKTQAIGFRVTEEGKAEWERWQALAKQEGVEFRDWLFPKVRQALAPKPKMTAPSDAKAAYVRGQRLGMMVGRLDAIFEQEWEDQIDLGRVVAWVAKYPDLAQDLVQILTQRSYGVRFHAWWQQVIGAPTPATARIPSAHR